MGASHPDAPVLLLPPSKGKAAGGDGPPYARELSTSSPLGAARKAVLDALEQDLEVVDDRTLARIAGVRPKDLAAAKEQLRELRVATTLPAHRRYTGIVHGNAGLAHLDPTAVAVDVRMVSALAGLVDLEQPLPPYRLEFAASLPSLGGLAGWWRLRLAEHLAEVVDGRRVWDLLPGEHARIWDPAACSKAEVIRTRFVRPDGRAANAARTKVCKGRLAAFVIAHPDLDIHGMVDDADPGAGWTLAAAADGVRATFVG